MLHKISTIFILKTNIYDIKKITRLFLGRPTCQAVKIWEEMFKILKKSSIKENTQPYKICE